MNSQARNHDDWANRTAFIMGRSQQCFYVEDLCYASNRLIYRTKNTIDNDDSTSTNDDSRKTRSNNMTAQLVRRHDGNLWNSVATKTAASHDEQPDGEYGRRRLAHKHQPPFTLNLYVSVRASQRVDCMAIYHIENADVELSVSLFYHVPFSS